MKTVFPVMFLMLLLLLSGQASGSFWFQVIGVSPISMAPNSEANFSIAVKGLGSNGAYVQLVFKNMTQGLEVSCPKMIKYVLPAGITMYNCTLRAGDVAPGNYSFVVDVAAKGSPSGKKAAYVDILGVNGQAAEPPIGAIVKNASANETQSAKSNQAASMPGSQPKGTPAPGVILGALCLLLASRRMMI
jgi:hypothetical protein